jgi:benzoate-CoA ligase
MVPAQPHDRGYLEVPQRFNIAEAVLDRHIASGHGSRIAVWASDRNCTFAELRELSNRFGNVLRALGVGRSDRVLLRMGTNLNAAVAILGTIKVGAIAIPTNPLFREHELEKILRNSGASVAVATAAMAGPLEALRARLPSFSHLIVAGDGRGAMSWEYLMGRAPAELRSEPTLANEPAFIVYTSGTTGEPKGVEHAHRWLIGAGDPVNRVMTSLTPDDVCYQPQDWSFVYPLGSGLLFPLFVGASVVIPEGRFDPESAFTTIERRGVTVFCAVPTIYRMMLTAPASIPRAQFRFLRMGVSAGEALPADTFNGWRERFGVTVYDGIGQSECHIFIANRPGMGIKPGSMGQPLPGYEVAILDDNGDLQAAGVPGHLVISSRHPGLAIGYRNEPERWAEVNRGDWYYTKDIAHVDDDGYYWYVSRSDDLIKSRAYLISPKEVESALQEHPAVLEAAVVGIPAPEVTQKVKAFVTLKAGYEASESLADEIRASVRELIAPYKAPQEMEFLGELPKTANGKILRRELRERG